MKFFKNVKKLIAAALGLCMAVAILPAGIPSAKAANETLTYTFTHRDSTAAVSTITKDNEDFNWYFHSENLYLSSGKSTGNSLSNRYLNVTGLEATSNYVAYNLEDVKVGYYNAAISRTTSAACTIVDIYLIPASTAKENVIAACTKDTKLGSFDGYSASEAHYQPVELAMVNIPSDGDYALVIRGTGTINPAANAKYHAVYPHQFVLTPARGFSASLSADSVDELGSVGLSVSLIEGGVAVECDYSVAISDPAKARYNATTKKIEALAPGSVTVTVTSGSYSKELALTINEVKKDIEIDFINTERTDVAAENFAGDGWKFYDRYTTNGANSATGFRGIYMLDICKGGYFAFELENVFAGEYSAVFTGAAGSDCGMVELFLVPKCDKSDIEANLTAVNSLGVVDFYDASKGFAYRDNTPRALKNFNVTESGSYLLVIKGENRANKASANYNIQFRNFKMTYEGPAATAKEFDAAFSPKYAFVRPVYTGNVKSYEVTFMGAIKIDDLSAYQEVGFTYVTEDGKTQTKMESNVYETFTFADGNTLTAADLDADYLFFNSFIIGADEAFDGLQYMTFNAVAKTAEGATVSGAECSVQICQ